MSSVPLGAIVIRLEQADRNAKYNAPGSEPRDINTLGESIPVDERYISDQMKTSLIGEDMMSGVSGEMDLSADQPHISRVFSSIATVHRILGSAATR